MSTFVLSPYPIQISRIGAMAIIGSELMKMNAGMRMFCTAFDHTIRIASATPPNATTAKLITYSLSVVAMLSAQW